MKLSSWFSEKDYTLGFWKRLFGYEERSIHPFLADSTWYQGNASGEPVTPTSALGLSAVYSCVSLLADTIATLPADAFIKVGDTREPAPVKPVWLDEPGGDPWTGTIEMLNQVMSSVLLSGTAYVLTPRFEGQVTGLVALDPAKVHPNPEGGWAVDGQPLNAFELMPIRGLMLPGSTMGCSPITYARESVGSALAAQKFGAAFFGNGAWPGVVAEVPGPLSEDGQKAMKAMFNEVHKGSSNAHKIGVLTEGAKLNRLTLSPEDSQFIQTRQFHVADVARLFRVPPHLIADASGSTSWGSGLAEQDVAFAKYSLRPWVERIEHALTRLWLSEGGPDNGFIKLNMAAVLRGSTKDRYEAYAIGLDKGFLTKNEVRALEDLPPLDEPSSTPKVGF